MSTLVSPEYQAKYDYSQGYTDNPYPVDSDEYKRYQAQMNKQIDQEDL